MTIEDRLTAFLKIVSEEAARNPTFAAQLEKALEATAIPKPKRSGRRSRGPLDPFDLYRKGEATLEDSLNTLDMEQLRDIVAEHGMDPMRLAMKWKSKERVVELIVSVVRERSARGDAFRDDQG